MKLDKILTIASTEFGSAIRTKSFLIGLLLLPIIMGVSIVLQMLLVDRVDTRTRRFAVIDHSGALIEPIREALQQRDESLAARGLDQKEAPRFELLTSTTGDQDATGALLGFSDQVRSGDLDCFIEIPADVAEPASAGVRYHSDNPGDDVVRAWLGGVINDTIRSRRFREAGLDRTLADRLGQPVTLDNLGLLDREPATATGTSAGEGGIKEAERVDPIRTFAVPAVLLFVTFFVVMTSAPQLLNSVLEEKMSRISEVLLGSASPFELMMGKLLGNVALAMLLAALYVGGAIGVAAYYGQASLVEPRLVGALALFIPLAVLLYGSLYMAVGAACSELKDAQSLMMPVMLLSMLPMFFWTAILRDPASKLAVGMSLFPPATPYLMLMRMAMRPAPPAWQVALGIVLTSLTAIACVWAAGKILRVGLLMHGKPPSFRELGRWVLAR